MGRHQHHMDEEAYSIVKNECRDYLRRREIIKKGKASEDVIIGSLILNHAFERAVQGFEKAEVEAYCSDIVYDRGYCNSAILPYISHRIYVYRKQDFAHAVADMLGL